MTQVVHTVILSPTKTMKYQKDRQAEIASLVKYVTKQAVICDDGRSIGSEEEQQEQSCKLMEALLRLNILIDEQE